MREGRRKLKVGQSGLAKWPARNSGGSRTKYRLRRHGHRPSPPWAVWALAHRSKQQGRDLSDPGPGSGLAMQWHARKNLEVGDESENWSPALGAIGERRAMKAETRR